MKRTRIIGLCLVAVCAMFALVASSAMAVENMPEYGKCVANSHGKYSGATCTKLAKAGKEKDEWEPLATTVPFTSKKLKNTGNAVLEAASGQEISCSEQSEKEGEYGPGNKVKNVIGEFSGCAALGASCNSNGAKAGDINTFKLDGEPGIVEHVTKEEKNVDGNDLRGEAAPNGSALLAEFDCGPAPIKVKGGVVVRAEQKGKLITNKMLNKVDVEFVSEKPGKQNPEKWTPNFEGTSNTGTRKEITEHLESSIANGSYEPSGQSLITEQKTVGGVKVELRQCEKTVTCNPAP
jgi:hypothetical protein